MSPLSPSHAGRSEACRPSRPRPLRRPRPPPRCRRLIFDIVALAIAARDTDYVRAALEERRRRRPCTAFGHGRKLGLYDAALVNGTAAHGEDYDDTFEGGPIHAGAVIVSAVLAVAEQRGFDGRRR